MKYSVGDKFPEVIFWTKFSLISTPIVFNPDFANDKAVGSPILPIPITQTLMDFEFSDSVTSSILFILIFKLDIKITAACIFEPIFTYYNFVMIAFIPKC